MISVLRIVHVGEHALLIPQVCSVTTVGAGELPAVLAALVCQNCGMTKYTIVGCLVKLFQTLHCHLCLAFCVRWPSVQPNIPVCLMTHKMTLVHVEP